MPDTEVVFVSKSENYHLQAISQASFIYPHHPVQPAVCQLSRLLIDLTGCLICRLLQMLYDLQSVRCDLLTRCEGLTLSVWMIFTSCTYLFAFVCLSCVYSFITELQIFPLKKKKKKMLKKIKSCLNLSHCLHQRGIHAQAECKPSYMHRFRASNLKSKGLRLTANYKAGDSIIKCHTQAVHYLVYH